MSTNKVIKVENYEREMRVVEEYLNIDESLIEMEKNKDLIRMEMNIVEFPIFSRSNMLKINQIKKYYFSVDKTSFLEIIPAYGTMIPGELEERVFIALIKIFRNNNYNQTFYCTLNDIFDNMKIEKINTRRTLYPKVKKAISKLATTTYRFKNLFYSSEVNRLLDDFIETNILTYRAVRLKDATEKEKSFFNDKRLKEVYKISVSQHFYDNIIKKGYLAFDADELLNLKDAITRSIYTMITKWRKSNLYLTKPAFYIARRIPLAWEGNPRRTVLRIEKSLEELKNGNYIKNYKLNKKGKWDEAIFEMFFSEDHNKTKKDVFYDEKSTFDKMIIHVEDRQNELEINTPNIFTDPYFMEIFNIFPEVAKKFKTLPNVIRDGLKNHEFKYVKYTAEYTALFCKTSYIKYFKEALENNWADEYIVKKEAKLEKKEKINTTPLIEEAINVEEKPIENLYVWEDFIALSPEYRSEVEAAAYENFLVESNAVDNKIMKNIFEKSKKSMILKIMSEYKIPKGIIPTEELVVEKEIEIQIPLDEKKEVSNEIIGEYVSVTEFMVTVSKVAKEKSIAIDFEHLVPIFKLFREYEDKFIKIIYDEGTKQGIISIKG